MVAYSFKARFADPIIAGTKLQTIRAPRKRHARPGEELQLYTGMRTKHCKLIGRRTCSAVHAVRIDLDCGHIEYLESGRALTMLEEVDAFARNDGFADWRDMHAFWRAEHPGVDTFEGVLIRWTPPELGYCRAHMVPFTPPGCPICAEEKV